MSANRDDRKPATFKTPEGDIIKCMTWAGIADKLAYLLEPIITLQQDINASLTIIDNKLDEWIPVDSNNDEEAGD